MITPDVYALRDEFRLPHNYVGNTTAYRGTQDNPTTRGWYADLPDDQRRNLWSYLKRPAGTIRDGSSKAALAIAPLQVLSLGAEARMNVPGRVEGNWRWRCTKKMVSDPAFEWLRNLTKSSNRLGMTETPKTSKDREVVLR
jgi:4-alpha-glucanotransferase